MRVALYACVSARDKNQNPQNQLRLLRRKAARAGNTRIKEYVDEESGGKASRRQFRQSLKDAAKRQFGLVRFFALNRFSSEAVFDYTARLDQEGVAFWSYCEPMLNTTGPMAASYKSIIAWAAGYRNRRHSENVRLGQARKRAQVEAAGGTYQHGRRPTGPAVMAQVRELAAKGMSRQIALAAGVPVGRVQHCLAR